MVATQYTVELPQCILLGKYVNWAITVDDYLSCTQWVLETLAICMLIIIKYCQNKTKFVHCSTPCHKRTQQRQNSETTDTLFSACYLAKYIMTTQEKLLFRRMRKRVLSQVVHVKLNTQPSLRLVKQILSVILSFFCIGNLTFILVVSGILSRYVYPNVTKLSWLYKDANQRNMHHILAILFMPLYLFWF